MHQRIGARAFLKREGFIFGMAPDRLDDRLRRQLDEEQRERFDELACLQGVERTELLYSLPRTLKQAHLMFSHDAARTVASFDWLADVAADAQGPILDLGCGSGAFIRLLAARGNEQPLVGIDGSETLIAIASKQSAEVPKAAFHALDYGQISTLDRSFGLITAACALDWTSMDDVRGDDIPLDSCLPDQFVQSASVAKRVGTIASDLLRDARQIADADATLAMVERLKTFQEFVAFLAIASHSGWKIDFERSTRLKFADERMPGLAFKAADPAAFEFDLERLVAFWQGPGPWKFPVIDEAAILAYKSLEPAPSGTSQQTFHNGTMFTESGFLGDARPYSYRYATTGFRELTLA